jgi:hypothetical protein
MKSELRGSSLSLRQTVCSTFPRSGLSFVKSSSLAKGGTSKKRPSPHLHKFPTRNNKVSPRTFQMALVDHGRFLQHFSQLIVHIHPPVVHCITNVVKTSKRNSTQHLSNHMYHFETDLCIRTITSPVAVGNFIPWLIFPPISRAERSEASTVFSRSNVEIVGSNPARGMDVCLRFYVLCCAV